MARCVGIVIVLITVSMIWWSLQTELGLDPYSDYITTSFQNQETSISRSWFAQLSICGTIMWTKAATYLYYLYNGRIRAGLEKPCIAAALLAVIWGFIITRDVTRGFKGKFGWVLVLQTCYLLETVVLWWLLKKDSNYWSNLGNLASNLLAVDQGSHSLTPRA